MLCWSSEWFDVRLKLSKNHQVTSCDAKHQSINRVNDFCLVRKSDKHYKKIFLIPEEENTFLMIRIVYSFG